MASRGAQCRLVFARSRRELPGRIDAWSSLPGAVGAEHKQVLWPKDDRRMIKAWVNLWVQVQATPGCPFERPEAFGIG